MTCLHLRLRKRSFFISGECKLLQMLDLLLCCYGLRVASGHSAICHCAMDREYEQSLSWIEQCTYWISPTVSATCTWGKWLYYRHPEAGTWVTLPTCCVPSSWLSPVVLGMSSCLSSQSCYHDWETFTPCVGSWLCCSYSTFTVADFEHLGNSAYDSNISLMLWGNHSFWSPHFFKAPLLNPVTLLPLTDEEIEHCCIATIETRTSLKPNLLQTPIANLICYHMILCTVIQLAALYLIRSTLLAMQ